MRYLKGHYPMTSKKITFFSTVAYEFLKDENTIDKVSFSVSCKLYRIFIWNIFFLTIKPKKLIYYGF